MSIDQHTTYFTAFLRTEGIRVPPVALVVFCATDVDYDVGTLEVDTLSRTSTLTRRSNTAKCGKRDI